MIIKTIFTLPAQAGFKDRIFKGRKRKLLAARKNRLLALGVVVLLSVPFFLSFLKNKGQGDICKTQMQKLDKSVISELSQEMYKESGIKISPELSSQTNLDDEKSQSFYEYEIETPSEITLDDSQGGYILIKKPNHQSPITNNTSESSDEEEIAMLRAPQGIDSKGYRIDYKYELNKVGPYYTLRLVPARNWQLSCADYPVKIFHPITKVEWNEALVAVGENGQEEGNAKDGDVIAIKPAGWNWGLEERKRFAIVKIPKISNEDKEKYAGRTIQPQIEDYGPVEYSEQEKEYLFDKAGLALYGIDYASLSTPEQLADIRNPNVSAAPLDATAIQPGPIQKKQNPLVSVIPENTRLASWPTNHQSPITNHFVKEVYAAGTITKSIGSASRDYSTIAAWNTACGGATSCDLVANTEIAKGEMYADSTFTETGTVINAFTTSSASYYPWLTAPTTERHNGTAGTGVVLDPSTASHGLQIAEANTLLEWMEVTQWNTGGTSGSLDGINITATDVTMQYVIVHDDGATGNNDAGGIQTDTNSITFTVRNSIVYNTGRWGISTHQASSSSMNIENATVLQCMQDEVETRYGCIGGDSAAGGGGTYNVKNTIAMPAAGDKGNNLSFNKRSTSSWGTSDFNISLEDTAPGSNSQHNKLAANQFISTTASSENLHLKAGSDAYNKGTNLWDSVTDDVDGDSRPQGDAWDIGADEIAEGVNPPISRWKFDEATGTTAEDDTNYNNDLTISGATWYVDPNNRARQSTYLQFDGTNDLASRTNDADFNFGTGSFSITGWFRHPSTVSGQDTLMARFGTAGWKIYMNSSGFICFGIDGDSTWTPADDACTTTSFADSRWHHFAAVKSGTSSITLYIDGYQKDQDASLTANGSLNTSSTLYVGIDSDGTSNPWTGFLDDISIYNYALSTSQIYVDITGGSQSFGVDTVDPLSDGLVGYWKMDESSGNATDYSGAGFDLNNYGTVTYTGGKFANGSEFVPASSQYFSPAEITHDNTTTASTGSSGAGIDSYSSLDDKDGAGTVSLSWTAGTNDGWSTVAVSVNPATTIAHDNTTTAYQTSGSSLTFSKTNTGSNLILFVAIGTNGGTVPTVSGVTYAGDSLTSLGQIISGGSQFERTSLWYKVNPATGANNVVITADVAGHLTAVATSYTGVDQTTPVDTPVTNSGASGNPSTGNVSSATGDIVVAALGINDIPYADVTPDSGQTQRGETNNGGGFTFAKTNSGSNLILFVAVGLNQSPPATVSLVTYAGEPLTELGEIISGGGQFERTSLWYKVNPATGTNNVIVSATKDSYETVVATSYTGVDQNNPVDTPVTNSGASGNPSTGNVSSSVGDLVIAALGMNDISTSNVTPDGSQNQRGETNDGGSTNSYSSLDDKNGAGTVSLSWTAGANNGWSTVAVSVNPANFTSFQDVHSISFWVNPDSNTNYYASLTSSAYITSSSGTLSATGFTNPKIYVNGVQSAAITADTWQLVTVTTDTPIDADQFFVGRQGSNYFDGTMDEVRLYNRTFSPSEIAQLYSFGPGPVAYYKFDEGIGTSSVADSSGNGNTGTMNGSMTASDWVPGKFGSALDFDGSNDYVDAGTGSSIVNVFDGGGTLETWVYPKTQSGTKGISGKVYALYLEPSGNNFRIEFDYDRVTVGGGWLTDYVIPVNQWTHIAINYDPISTVNDPTIYLNGVSTTVTEWQTPQGTRTDDTGFQLLIGQANGSFKKAVQDEFKLYNYSRTPKQIVEDMNAGHPAPGSPIGSQTIYWPFDEQYGTTAYDTVRNENGVVDANTAWKLENSTSGGCKLNGCLEFDAAGEEVLITDANDTDINFNGSEPFSGSAWIRVATMPGTTDEDAVIAKWDATNLAEVRAYRLYLTDSDGDSLANLNAQLYDESANQAITASSTNEPIAINTWYHVAFTFNGGIAGAAGDLKVYVDGRFSAQNSVNASFLGVEDVAADFTVAEYDTTDAVAANTAFTGRIDEVKIYSGLLTADEIKIDATAGSASALGGVLGTHDSEGFLGNPPVGWWKLDEKTGSGTQVIKDTSGNNYHLSTQSMNSTAWRSGKIGSAIATAGSASDDNFCSDTNANGTCDANTALQLSGDMTFETWLYPINIDTGTDVGRIVFEGIWGAPISANNFMYTLTWDKRFGGNELLYEHLYGIASFESYSFANSALTANQWQHIVFTRDNTAKTVKLYLNGTYKDTFTYTNSPSDGSDGILRFGAQDNGNNQANIQAYFDEVKIYNYARTQAQIAYDYNRGAPVAWYQFDECQGAVAYNAALAGSGAAAGMNGTINARSLGNTAVGTCSSGTGTEMWNDGTTGKFNASLGFDGADDDVSVTNASGIDLNEGLVNGLTISSWVYANSDGEGDIGKIFTKGTETLCQTDSQSGSNLDIQCELDLATDATLNISSTITTGTWNHVVVSWSDDGDDEITIWINGINRGSSTDGVGPTSADTSNLIIGNDSTQANTFDGLIDNFQIYTYEMTAAQIQKVYNEGGAVRFGP